MITCHLQSLLDARGLTLYRLARDLGVHRNSLRALVRNQARQFDAGLLDSLCRYLGCELGDLISFTPDGASHQRLTRPGAGYRRHVVLADAGGVGVSTLMPPDATVAVDTPVPPLSPAVIDREIPPLAATPAIAIARHLVANRGQSNTLSEPSALAVSERGTVREVPAESNAQAESKAARSRSMPQQLDAFADLD